MLELPPNIRIGYKDYSVEVMPDDEREKNIGWHKPQQHLIQVATDLPPREVVNTYLHEIFHAILTNAAFRVKEELEEDLVNCMANGLTQIFVDNPEVIKWMLKLCQRETKVASKAR